MVSSTDHTAVADLGKCGAALGHSCGDHGDGVFALTCGPTEAVGGDVGLAEDSGVDFSDLVLSGAGDDATLDTDGGTVASCITDDGSNLAVSRDEGGGEGEGGEENGVSVEVHDC